MKKVLFVSNTAGFSIFNAPYFSALKNRGWVVHNAAPGLIHGVVDFQHDIPITRSPFSFGNLKAYFALKKIIDNNHFDLIHVHTPVGALIGRLAARKARRKGTKVIYTAHGFHFYKGAPLRNWLLFCPIELMLSSLTDAIVTINDEDTVFAKAHNIANGNIFRLNGIGVDLTSFYPSDENSRIVVRKKLGYSQNNLVCLFSAQLIKRKNHKFLLDVLPEIKNKEPKIRFLFAGGGPLLNQLIKKCKDLQVDDIVSFLGWRADMPELCNAADIYISTSKQEGMAIGNIEAMASGCILLLSNIRGHKEAIEDGKNGFLFNLKNPNEMKERLFELASKSSSQRQVMQQASINKAKEFSLEKSLNDMMKIYKTVFGKEL